MEWLRIVRLVWNWQNVGGRWRGLTLELQLKRPPSRHFGRSPIVFLFPAHLRVGNRIDLRLACCFSMRADAPSIGGCSVSMISADRCAFVTRIGLVLARPLPIECRWG